MKRLRALNIVVVDHGEKKSVFSRAFLGFNDSRRLIGDATAIGEAHMRG